MQVDSCGFAVGASHFEPRTGDRNLPMPWGEHSMVIALGGEVMALQGLTSLQAEEIGRSYQVVDQADDQEATPSNMISVTFQRGAVPKVRPGRFTVNQIYTPETRYMAQVVEVLGCGFAAKVDLTGKCSSYLTTEQEELTAQPIVLQNFLRVSAAYIALRRGGLLLHSAAIVIDDRAHLFVGRSGAGKTTLSRKALAAGCKVLSDDAVMVLPSRGYGFEVRFVPFAGELGMTCADRRQYAVATVNWLIKTEHLALSEIAPSVQVARALACCPTVNADPFRVEQTISNLENLFRCYKMPEFRSSKDEDFANVAELLTTGSSSLREAENIQLGAL